MFMYYIFFFFQAEDGIRDHCVTGVQTCALPIFVLGGKFLWVGQKKLYVRGVTYGTFRPSMDGSAFPSPRVVEQDFSLMSANGVNAVRTYTTPPHWLLEIALRCNLRVLVGMQGERHYAFLHEKKMVRQIRNQVRSGARACAGHRAVLGYL